MTRIIVAVIAWAGVLLAGCTASSLPAAPSSGAPASTGATGTGAAAPATTATAPASSAKPTVEPVASTAAIPDSALPRVRFVTKAGTPVSLPIEVPPEREYGIGLSGRTTLGERGMLFYFPQVTDTPFWMQDTHIDLDIVFISRDLKVLAAQTMKADTLDYHTADGVFTAEQYQRRNGGTPYLATIEAPAGWYAAHQVQAGDAVVFDFDLKAATGR